MTLARSPDAMTVSVQLNENDIGQFSAYAGPTMNRRAIFCVVVCGMLAGAVGDAFSKICSRLFAVDAGLPVFLAFFIFLYVVLLRSLRSYYWRGRYSPEGAYLAPHQLSLNPEGIRYTNSSMQSFLAWPGVLRMEQTKSNLLFFIDYTAAYIVPKRSFPSAAAAAEFYAQAQSLRNIALANKASEAAAP